jgi:integral membrane protein (TIGR01906 family)
MQAPYFKYPFWLFRAFASLVVAVFIITTNVGLVASSSRTHEALFARHDVAARAGLTISELNSVNKEVLQYLASQQEPLYIEATVQGVQQALFSQREIIHMADVKALFKLNSQFRFGSGLFLLVAAIISLILVKRTACRVIAKCLRDGALLLLISVALISFISIIAFQPLFTFFHQIGFRNDLWLLDPATDMLLRLYPLGFWRDATIILGGFLIVQTSILITFAILGLTKFFRSDATAHYSRS